MLLIFFYIFTIPIFVILRYGSDKNTFSLSVCMLTCRFKYSQHLGWKRMKTGINDNQTYFTFHNNSYIVPDGIMLLIRIYHSKSHVSLNAWVLFFEKKNKLNKEKMVTIMLSTWPKELCLEAIFSPAITQKGK